jgi:hypothetical protein
MSKPTVKLPIRRVNRLVANPDGKRLYCVMERRADSPGWFHASKAYEHSTSAFAALGRLTQKDTFPEYN